MRTQNSEVSVDEYYHLFNRGAEKKTVFLDKCDYARFLFLILYFQSSTNFYNLNRPVSSFVRSQTFNIDTEKEAEVIKTRKVELGAFCLMPNHFHLLIREIGENGIAKYMQRVLTAYAKYFNTKYNHSGHVFQGTYKVNHVEDNDQLLYLSAYIHKNPSNYANYPWSSYPNYIKKNSLSELLNLENVLAQFKSPQEYADWVEETTAKEINDFITPHDVELLEV